MKKFILICLCLLVSLIPSFADTPTQVNNGRYILYQHPTFRAEQFLLDTQTGKIWQLVLTKDGEKIWEEMFFDCYNTNKTYSGRYLNPR